MSGDCGTGSDHGSPTRHIDLTECTVSGPDYDLHIYRISADLARNERVELTGGRSGLEQTGQLSTWERAEVDSEVANETIVARLIGLHGVSTASVVRGSGVSPFGRVNAMSVLQGRPGNAGVLVAASSLRLHDRRRRRGRHPTSRWTAPGSRSVGRTATSRSTWMSSTTSPALGRAGRETEPRSQVTRAEPGARNSTQKAWPPATTSETPVMKPASGAARKEIARATSSTFPAVRPVSPRPSRPSRRRRGGSTSRSLIGPGSTALIVIAGAGEFGRDRPDEASNASLQLRRSDDDELSPSGPRSKRYRRSVHCPV